MLSHIVVGLGYGDEGKGSWVDYLVREHKYEWVVRFNGGAQAAHHVVTSDRVHCFSQYGAGTLAGAGTILTKAMLVDPLAFLVESKALEERGVKAVVLVDQSCAVVTPVNTLLNRILERARGKDRHGSCGRGIGLTRNDVESLGDQALYVKDLADRNKCREKLQFLWELKREQAEKAAEGLADGKLIDTYRRMDLDAIVERYASFLNKVVVVSSDEDLSIISQGCVFESAQGVLLDQLHGFYPHVTKSDTTFRLALELLDSAGFNGERTKVGLLRGYSTRHGAGPFVSEDTSLNLPACHNAENEWQGRFRLGWFDVVAARYALRVVGGVDCLAITNLDRMSGLKEVKICTLYNSPNDEFFTRGDLRVLVNPSVEDLARRTQMMKECKPFFDVTEGWQDTNSVTGYLQILGHLLQREVDAISVSDTAAGKRVFAREVITQ